MKDLYCYDKVNGTDSKLDDINSKQQCNVVKYHVSTDGYYGYQNHLPVKDETMKVTLEETACEMDTDESISTEIFLNGENIAENVRACSGRKRMCAYDMCQVEFKKLRQEEYPVIDPVNSTPPTVNLQYNHFRQPTHNLPDISRCRMEAEKVNKSLFDNDIGNSTKLLEELLEKTHGCTWYHWTNDSN